MEATCDITLPRSEGTCTRCPFQITTTAQSNPSEPWVCTVSILHQYVYSKNAGMTGAEFDHFKSIGDTNVTPFAVIRDKADLESTLKRAQLAVLNPDKDPNTFRDSTVTMFGKNTIGFSPNIISLKIEAPGLPELSFFDLPGAINSMGNESEQYLVDFVEKLLEIYVKDEKALILLACAANQDVETSTALRLLRKWKATARAMGVLTKPDLVDLTQARQANLQRILDGQDFALAAGWFITRQLSQKQLDQASRPSHAQARQEEAEFFSTAPWCTVLADYADRFGVCNLQRAISEKLTTHIVSNLPSIEGRVQERLEVVFTKLGQFPEKDPAPALAVHIEYTKVQDAIQKRLASDSKSKFRADYQSLMYTFRDKVKGLRPEVDMSTPGYEKPVLELDSEDEDETPTKKRRLNKTRESPFVTPESRLRQKSQIPTESRTKMNKTAFTLEDAKEKFDAASSGFVGQSTPEVSKNYAIQAIKRALPKATTTVLNQVQELFTKMLLSTIDEVLATRQSTELFGHITKITQELLMDLVEETRQFISRLVKAELSRPITYSEQISERIEAQKGELRKRRAATRVREHFEVLESENGMRKVPTIPEQEKKAADPEWIKSQIGTDSYSREVAGLALPLAYYEMVTASFVDLVAKQVEYGIITRYQNDLNKALVDCLKVNDSEYCAQLLAEEPQRERERIALQNEQSRLERALNELRGLRSAYS